KNNWTPFGLCSAESLRGIKHFQGQKTACKLKPLPTQKNISKNNWTPFGLCSAESLRGIKHFQGQKTVCKLKPPPTPK
ncbi:MAG: hypothetical protein AAGI90_07260, partial [Chlamydiota bacterium]